MKKNIECISVNYKETIINALKVMDSGAKGIIYVIDDNLKLLGTITDGDIRRALINNISLENSIDTIMNKNPIKTKRNIDEEQVKSLMIKKAIRELPIVDEKGTLIDTISLNDLIIPKGKNNYVVIMAGGLGSRLKELTKEIPKPMLNLGDRPILQHIIENFKMHRFNKFLISVNYKSEVIENYFQDGSNYGCKINYLKENKRLGTAGPLFLAKEYIEDDFFVVNGDIYSNTNLNEIMDFHKSHNNDITIVSIKRSVNIPYGVIDLNGNKVNKIIEKPKYEFVISGGIYCLSPKVIELIPKDQYYEITELFDECLKRGLKVESYIMDDYWVDIGRIEDYNKINTEIYDLICCDKEGEKNDK